MNAARVAAALASIVAVLDVVQVAALPLAGARLAGAVVGAGLYTALAVGAWRAHRGALWVLCAMPLVPFTVLVGSRLGALPLAADATMLGVAAVQLSAAAAALLALWIPSDTSRP